MNKILEMGAFPIQVSEFLDPAAYWGFKFDDENENANRRQLNEMEIQMTKMFQKGTTPSLSNPYVGCVVAVEEPSHKTWLRAKIVQLLPGEGPDMMMAKVFLVDYGRHLSVCAKNLHILPDWALYLWPLAVQFNLYGVLPIHPVYNEENHNCEFQITQQFMPVAMKKVKQELEKSTNVFFVPQKNWNQQWFGDLFLSQPGSFEPKSMTAFLTGCNLAVYSPADFEADFSKRISNGMNLREGFKDSNSSKTTKCDEPVEKVELQDFQSTLKNGSLPSKPLNANVSFIPACAPFGGPTNTKPIHPPQVMAQPMPSLAQVNTREKQAPNFWSKVQPKKLSADGDGPEGGETAEIRDSFQHPDMTNTLTCKLDLQKNPSLPVLVQGKYIETPLNNLSTAPFHTDILKALQRSGFKEMTNVQRYMWAAVIRGLNVVAVGDAKAGKSIGYLAPLASRHLEIVQPNELTMSAGPISLILCATELKAEAVESLLRSLLMVNKLAQSHFVTKTNMEDKVKIVLVTGSSDPKKKTIELLNGCHVLVSTPPALKKVLDAYPDMAIDFKRLRTTVLDDADILFEKFKPEVDELLSKGQSEVDPPDVAIQFILASKQWSAAMKEFSLTRLAHAEFMMPTGLEILAYGSITPMAQALTLKDDRYLAAIEVLTNAKNHKCIVCCSSIDEAKSLHSVIVAKGHSNSLLVASLENSTINMAKLKWLEPVKLGQCRIMVVADECLPLLTLDDASLLIHFSMPDVQQKFNYRMVTVHRRVPKIFDPKISNPQPEVHIFVDPEKDVKPIPVLVRFLERIGANVPSKLVEIAKREALSKEQAKGNAPLCKNICSFGKCHDMSLCNSRHALNELDLPTEFMPRSGDVSLSVTHVHDATHFSGRIVESRGPDGDVQKHDTREAVTLAMDMAEHYSDKDNKTCQGTVSPGALCALESSPEVFQRVQIEQILARDKNGNASKVLVRSLDEGWRLQVEVVQLLFLPKDLRQVKAQVVDFYLCGLMPKDGEREWGLKVTKTLMEQISYTSNMLQEGYYLKGKIGLTLGEKIWLQALDCCRLCPKSQVSTKIYSFGSTMIKKNLAVPNAGHLSALRSLCNEANIALPALPTEGLMRTSEATHSEVAEADWAFLSSGEYTEVKATMLDSPSSFFVQNTKFADLFDYLLNDICDHQLSQSKNAWKKVNKDVGAFILAKFPQNQTWNRAKITEVHGDDLTCYFVDQGTFERVKCQFTLPLPEKFLRKLPCQAIVCSLHGVKPKDSQAWPESAVSVFANLVWSTANESSAHIFVKVFGKKKSDVTGGWHYFVKMYNSEKKQEVGSALVEMGLAEFDTNFKEEDLSAEFWQKLSLNETDIQDDDEAVLSEMENDDPIFPIQSISETPCVKSPSIKVPILKDDDADGWDFQNLESFLGKGNNHENEEATQQQRADKKDEELDAVVTEEESAKQKSAKPEMAAVPQQVLPPKKPLFISTCYDTRLVWTQTKEHIRIKILLVGVDDYYLKITPAYVDFATKCQGRAYCVNINLFGYVWPKKCTYQAQGQYMELKLHKLLDTMWPRLDHPDRGIVGASHSIEKYTKTYDDDSSDEDDIKKSQKAMLGGSQPRVVSTIGVDMYDEEESETEEDIQLLKNYDPFDPIE